MNSVYFVCRTCKTYHDAGYRWAYWHLERPGIVERGKPISIEAVFQTNDYWMGEKSEEDAQQLHRALPRIRRYLETHQGHDLFYDEYDAFFWHDGEDEELDWLDEEELDRADKSPRLFVHRLGYTTWQQVVKDVEHSEPATWPDWWYDPIKRGAAKRKFESLLEDALGTMPT